MFDNNIISKDILKTTLLTLIGVALIVGGGVFYFINQKTDSAKEYLIPGVPYWGSYKGTSITTDTAFAAYTVLSYWGDSRFSSAEIAQRFSSAGMLIAGNVNKAANTVVGSNELINFFEKNGYNVEIVTVSKISDIYQYIDADIPVILSQGLSPDFPAVPILRVIIGYSEKDNTLIIHDNIFGNNYPFLYKTFNKLTNDGLTHAAIIIRPGKNIKNLVTGLDKIEPYPKRLTIMDSPSMQNIQKKWIVLSFLEQESIVRNIDNLKQKVQLWEDILHEKDFDKLHPAARMIASRNLARLYSLYLNEQKKAINVLNTITIPLLSLDFSKPFGEWERHLPPNTYSSAFYAQPWIILGAAHYRSGDINKASDAFNKALTIDPLNLEARSWLQENAPLISFSGKDVDEAFIEKLTIHAWEGTLDVIGSNFSRQLKIVFIKDPEKILRGMIYIIDAVSNEPIKNVAIKNNVLYFQSSADAWYQLYFDGDVLVGQTYKYGNIVTTAGQPGVAASIVRLIAQ